MLDKTSIRILHKKILNSHQVCGNKPSKKALSVLKEIKARNILLFVPLSYEPNILSLRKILSSKAFRAKLFLPFMLDKSLKIVKLRLPFFKGRFNVRQAANSNAHIPRLDAAIIPVIGVDSNMARIGHGQGFYDRFFGSLHRKPCLIFISSQDLFINASVCDPHDIIGDFYITPKNIRKNHDRNHHRSSRSRDRRWCWLSGS